MNINKNSLGWGHVSRARQSGSAVVGPEPIGVYQTNAAANNNDNKGQRLQEGDGSSGSMEMGTNLNNLDIHNNVNAMETDNEFDKARIFVDNGDFCCMVTTRRTTTATAQTWTEPCCQASSNQRILEESDVMTSSPWSSPTATISCLARSSLACSDPPSFCTNQVCWEWYRLVLVQTESDSTTLLQVKSRTIWII